MPNSITSASVIDQQFILDAIKAAKAVGPVIRKYSEIKWETDIWEEVEGVRTDFIRHLDSLISYLPKGRRNGA